MVHNRLKLSIVSILLTAGIWLISTPADHSGDASVVPSTPYATSVSEIDPIVPSPFVAEIDPIVPSAYVAEIDPIVPIQNSV